MTRSRLPNIQLTAVPRENTLRARHASVRHNPGANPMRGIGIACPVLYPESPVNSSEAVISGPSPQLHAPPHVASLGVQKMIPSGHPPIPNHDSALVSTAHPRRSRAAHVHPNPFPACQTNGSRLQYLPACPSPSLNQGLS